MTCPAGYARVRLVNSAIRRLLANDGTSSGGAKSPAHPATHWITSSALASSFSGTVSPSAFAVLRLITSSNLIGT